MTRSYSHGASSVRSSGRRSGRTSSARWRGRGDHDALVVPFQGVRLTYRAFDDEVDRVARGLLAGGLAKGERIGIWSPNNAEWVLVQYATAKIGAILVNINPAYRTHEVGYALQQSGCRMLVAATEFKGPATSPWSTRSAASCRRSSARSGSARATGTSCWPPATAPATTTLRARMADLGFDEPINIQYTSGTTGLPEGRDAQPSQHPEQRLVRRRGLRLHRGRPRLHPGALLPLLRHGARQPGGTTHGAAMVGAGAGVRPRRHAAGRRGRALHQPLRRADDVHRRAGPPRLRRFDLSSLRTGIMAGSPCPVEVMKQCITEMHMDEVTIATG